MENIAKAYEVLFMLATSDMKKAVTFADAIPIVKIKPELLIGYMKSDNVNIRTIAESLLNRVWVHNIDYTHLAKAAESDNKEVIFVIMNMAKRIEKHRLSLKALTKLTTSEFHNVRQLGYLLIVKNFVYEIKFSLLIKCQELEDDEFSSVARDVALKKCKNITPIKIFEFFESEIYNIRKLAKDICLLHDAKNHTFPKLYKLMKESDNHNVVSICAQVILHKFSDRLTHEDLEVLRIFNDEDVSSLVPSILMDRYKDKLNISDYIDFQTSKLGIVRSKAKVLAHEVKDLNLPDLMMASTSPYEQVRLLVWDLAFSIKTEDLDYSFLINWLSQHDEISNSLARTLLRSISTDIFDPEVLAVFQNSLNRNIVEMATELALSISADYSKEADEFIKTYF